MYIRFLWYLWYLLRVYQRVVWVQSSIFSNANIIKKKRIKRYNIKGIGCPLLISILTKKRENKKEEK